MRQERETRNRNKRISVRESAKEGMKRKGKRKWSEQGGYIYTQSRTTIRKSAVRIPPGEIWVADRQREDGMRGTDGEEVAGLGGGRGGERRKRRRGRGARAVVLLIVARRPEVQQRSVPPLGAPSLLLLWF